MEIFIYFFSNSYQIQPKLKSLLYKTNPNHNSNPNPQKVNEKCADDYPSFLFCFL